MDSNTASHFDAGPATTNGNAANAAAPSVQVVQAMGSPQIAKLGSGSGSGRRGSTLRSQNSELKQENEDLKSRLAQMEALMRSIQMTGGENAAALLASLGSTLSAPSKEKDSHSDFEDNEDADGDEEEESGIGDEGDVVSANEEGHANSVYTVEISARQLSGGSDGNTSLVVDGVSVQKKRHRKRRNKKKQNKQHTKLRRKRKNKPRGGKNARKRGRSVSFMATTEMPDTIVHEEFDGMPVDKKTEELKRRVLAELKRQGVEIKAVSTTARVERLLREELAKGKKSAFYLVNLGHVVHKLHQWQRLLPRILPHYAMKCNPDKGIVQTLQLLGIGFDCASKKELEVAFEVGARADQIIFANPCKQEEHIDFAKAKGVKMMTFDSKEELHKVMARMPDAQLVLRILPDDSNSLMPFGTKFGAARDEVSALLVEAKECKANLIGVSFHVGSGCYSVDAYTDAIRLARSVFDEAESVGFTFNFLDIGGGFPGTSAPQHVYESSDSDDDYFTTGMGGQAVDTSTMISFEEIAREIGPLIDELFPPEVKVISEPGRFFATAAATLAVNVVCRRERVRGFLKENTIGGAASSPAPATSGHASLPTGEEGMEEEGQQIEEFTKEVLYYLSDGIYGSFNNIIFDHATPLPALLTASEIEEGEGDQSLPSPPGIPHNSSNTNLNTLDDPDQSALMPPPSPSIGHGKPTERSCLFGPTCDSIDVICKNVELPRLNVGDWLYFVNMGAYTTASASNFNGISMPGYHYIMSLENLENS